MKLQKLKKRIEATLEEERKNIFEGHQDQKNLEGWIEALEHCLEEIESVENE